MKSNLSGLLTACLVVHNEGEIIERCLKSLKRVTGTILVVHDGTCSDNTLTICRSYGCFVVERKRVGMCEGHRVWTYQNTTTRWILQVDADEYLSDELIDQMESLINDSSISCYELLWPYWDGDQYRTKNWPYKKALFQKDKIKYIGFPHEEVHVTGKTQKVPYVLEHRPKYDNFSFKTFSEKHKAWIKIHADYHLSDPAKLEYYPVKDPEIVPHYSLITKYPKLIAPFIFTYHFTGLMVYGGIKEGWYGFRNSLVQALYYYLLCLEIGRRK